jgi:hypothetical protein
MFAKNRLFLVYGFYKNFAKYLNVGNGEIFYASSNSGLMAKKYITLLVKLYR